MIRVLPHLPTMGEKYIVDSDAEDPLTSCWGSYFGCPRAQTAVDKYSGAKCIAYTTNSSVNGQGAIVFHFRFMYSGIFRCGAWVKGLAGQGLRCGVRLWPTATETGMANYTLTGDWQFVQALDVDLQPRTTGPYGVGFEVFYVAPLPPIGTVLYVDMVEVRQVG